MISDGSSRLSMKMTRMEVRRMVGAYENRNSALV